MYWFQGFNSLTADSSSFEYSPVSFAGSDSAHSVQWQEVGSGNSYKIEVVSVFDSDNNDITDTADLPDPLINVSETAFLFWVGEGAPRTYTIKVTVINCMGEESNNGVEYTFTEES